jgi:hypothetical protein
LHFHVLWSAPSSNLELFDPCIDVQVLARSSASPSALPFEVREDLIGGQHFTTGDLFAAFAQQALQAF